MGFVAHNASQRMYLGTPQLKNEPIRPLFLLLHFKVLTQAVLRAKLGEKLWTRYFF